MDTSHSSEVRPANTLAARAAKVRQMHKEHIRTTLEQARDIGAELRAAKEQCVREGKPWLPWLDEAKMNHRTGQQYMRIAEHWSLLVDHAHFAAHGGVTEAINYLAGAVEEEKEIGTRPRSTNPAAGMAPAPPIPPKLCPKCERQGYRLNCERCQKLNQPPSRPRNRSVPDPTFAENLPARETFGPGADDGDLDEAAAALAAMLAKKVRHKVEAAALRLCKVVAESLGLEVVLQGVGADPKFSHPLIQQAYKKMMQAKWDLSHALVPPSEKTK